MGDESEGVASEKARLRDVMRRRRAAMSADEVVAESAKIHAQLEGFEPYTDARAVLSYVERGNEVQTRPLIEGALRAGRPVYVPVLIAGASNELPEMAWSRLGSLDDLGPGVFGVAEPREGYRDIAAPPIQSAVLVPGLAFTRGGARLGHGQGHFDRFLAGFEGVSIGLAYDWQVVESIPIESHDIPLHTVVSPTEVIETGVVPR